VDLKLGGEKSVFVVFRNHPATVKQVAYKPSTSIPVAGPWTLGIAGKHLTLDHLASWTEQSDADLKYFSGTATYRTTFQLEAEPQRMDLDLGDVRDLVRVAVNGKDLGVWWHPPFVRDVTAALRAGENVLELEVCNTWHNRLVGDEQFPVDFEWGADRGVDRGRAMKAHPDWFIKNEARPQPGRKGFVIWYYHRKETPLIPSGLLGPVKLVPMIEGVADEPGITGIKSAFLKQNLARVEDHCSHDGGGEDASALFDGVTGGETADDGNTFRGYGNGDWLELHFKRPCDLTEIQTFAQHRDARASQRYTVLAAYTDAPGKFVKLASGNKSSTGGVTDLRIPVQAANIVGVRFEFQDGPAGFNVYREFNLVGQPATGAKP
jgi:hypothetical protein